MRRLVRRFCVNAEAQVAPRRRFIDHLKLECKGGTGGSGSNSRLPLGPRKLRFAKGTADGGNGGDGGSVIFRASSSKTSLFMDSYVYAGEDGKLGRANKIKGRTGKNMYVHVPLGTVVRYAVEIQKRSQVNDESFADFMDVDQIDPTAAIPDE